jgi:hypothetical protein
LAISAKAASLVAAREKRWARNVSDKSDDDENKRWRRGWSYVLPIRIFPCTALQTLCAGHCRLKLPEIVNLSFLERLHIMAAAVIGGVTSKG